MNYLQLSQRLRSELGLSGSGPAGVVGQLGMEKKLVDWIASAWEEIQLMRNDWRFSWATGTFPVTAGVSSYSPSGMGLDDVNIWIPSSIRLIEGSTKRKLSLKAWDDFVNNYQTTEQGEPTEWAIAPDHTIYLSKVPDRAYTFSGEYYRTPQALASNSDTPRLPERYHMAIVYKAMMMYAPHDEAAHVFADAAPRYLALINKIESTELTGTIIGAGSLDGYAG